MRLNRVKIFGFKTFADRVEFDLEGGLVAVVGSNGCGKSNLVDAILWGLGEGNARQLRANLAQDVIFNGSPTRKPLGFAEVVLTFENEEGILPISATEVTISRRVTRGGDSEYRINRNVCRQRDIYELLADSGLGKCGYSIVGQREIDAALSASPDECRAWIDEVAGVQRYRQRRIEAQRRLTLAHDHLQRTLDILGELEAQREPLRAEAEVASRYKSILDSFQRLEKCILSREVLTSNEESANLELKIKEIHQATEINSGKSQSLKLESSIIGEAIARIESELAEMGAFQQQSYLNAERLETERKLSIQKLEWLDANELDLKANAIVLQQRICEAENDLNSAKLEANGEQASLIELSSREVGNGSKRLLVTDRLKEIQRQLAIARSLEAERIKVETENRYRLTRRKEIVRELAGISEGESDLAAGIATATSAWNEATASLAAVTAQFGEFESDLRRSAEANYTESEIHRKLSIEKASTEARAQGIASSLEANDGLPAGPSAIMDAVKNGQLKGNYAALGTAIEVDPNFASAIENALGSAIGDLIVESEEDAKQGIEFLKSERLGRATFQVLSLISSHISPPDENFLANSKGFVARASDLIKCNPTVRPVVNILLERTLIVETLDDALGIRRQSHPSISTLVTLNGEIVDSRGYISGGIGSMQSTGLVQRSSELSELNQKIREFEEQETALKVSEAQRFANRQSIQQRLEIQRKSVLEISEEEQDRQKFLQALVSEKADTQKSQQRLQREIETLQIEELDRDARPEIESLEATLQALLEELASIVADSTSLEARTQEVNDRFERSRSRLEACKLRLDEQKKTDGNREGRLQEIDSDRSRIKSKLEEIAAGIGLARQSLVESEEKFQVNLNMKSELIQQNSTVSEQMRLVYENSLEYGERAHKLELERARAQSKYSLAKERLIEEYELVLDEQVTELATEEIPADAESVMAKLRREIKAMGEVNLGAIAAYERLNERYVMLEAQQQDVTQGISEVEASIDDLDHQTKDRFLDALVNVQENFTTIFKRLFGGGEGKITLTSPNDALNSGVEIDVVLPGKKRQALSLLSGGERSLCAIAFLFSLLKVKSSPLVVLDEVDAPLDGSNVEIFIRLLNDFADTIQFIVITHNPATISAAPVWLGVTMREPGCSTLVPYSAQDRPANRPESALILA